MEFFRHRLSWRKLLALLSGLPSGSAYWAARADDDEAAAAVMAQTKGKTAARGGSAYTLNEMSTTNQVLLDILDMQQVVAHQLAMLRGAKGGQLVPVPRPETGMSRAKHKAATAQMDDLIAEAYEAMARTEAAEGAGHGSLSPTD